MLSKVFFVKLYSKEWENIFIEPLNKIFKNFNLKDIISIKDLDKVEKSNVVICLGYVGKNEFKKLKSLKNKKALTLIHIINMKFNPRYTTIFDRFFCFDFNTIKELRRYVKNKYITFLPLFAGYTEDKNKNKNGKISNTILLFNSDIKIHLKKINIEKHYNKEFNGDYFLVILNKPNIIDFINCIKHKLPFLFLYQDSNIEIFNNFINDYNLHTMKTLTINVDKNKLIEEKVKYVIENFNLIQKNIKQCFERCESLLSNAVYKHLFLMTEIRFNNVNSHIEHLYKIYETILKKKLVENNCNSFEELQKNHRQKILENVNFLVTRDNRWSEGRKKIKDVLKNRVTIDIGYFYEIHFSYKSFQHLAFENKINIKYIIQLNFNDIHRSGWQKVIENLMCFSSSYGVYFDTYMDRTFHFAEEYMINSNIIPYTSQWIGIIHHLPNEEYTPNNTESMFNKKTFLDSLFCCKGIFVLSLRLKKWVVQKLKCINLQIPVEVLIHPTTFDTISWSFDKFIENYHKKVVQVGSWMRNPFGIYELHQRRLILSELDDKYLYMNIGGEEYDFNFYVLEGKYMKSYIIPENLIYDDVFLEDGNKCVKYINKFITKITKPIEIISHLDNNNYDTLLSKNIVFLQLIDASAVNTVIECAVRNTPILLNRLPATEEILGSNYPFFYKNLTDAYTKLIDGNLIKKTHKYLKSLNKEKLTVNYFIKSLKESKIFKSL